MVQPQIVEYAASQTKLGLSKDLIKSALTGAGWSASDVDDSLKSLGASPAAKPEEKKPGGISIKLADLVGNSKLEPLPAKVGSSVAKKPDASAQQSASEGVTPKKGKARIVAVALAAVAFAGASGAVYFYLQTNDLQTSAASLRAERDTAKAGTAALTAQVDTLTKDKNDLTTKAGSLAGENELLSAKLSFFIVPPNVASSANMAFVIQGTIAGSASTLYTVTADDGIKVSIKNSKDVNVNAALKDLIGTKVGVSGTHAPGSKEVIVNAVNGASVVATSTAAVQSIPQTPPPVL